MVVEIGHEIEPFVFQIYRRAEQHGIETLASQGADEPLHEGMGQGNVGKGLDFCHLQNPQMGLPRVELIKRIVVGAEVLGQAAMPSNSAVKRG